MSFKFHLSPLLYSDSFSSASSSDTVIYDVLSKVSLDDLSVAVVLKAKKVCVLCVGLL